MATIKIKIERHANPMHGFRSEAAMELIRRGGAGAGKHQDKRSKRARTRSTSKARDIRDYS